MAMNRRRIILVISLLAMGFALLASWLMFSDKPHLTWEFYAIIKECKSVEELTTVIGRPPGDYSDGRRSYVTFLSECDVQFIKREYKISWCDNHGAIGLFLDADGNVRGVDYLPAVDPPVSLRQRIEEWLPWFRPPPIKVQL
jgi:hypothetical protein